MDLNERISKQLKLEMKKQGVTQVALAERMGLKLASVNQVVNGKRSGVAKPLEAILDALDLELVVKPKDG
jgi:transcriptional regulator with XRE-family HTH domain